LASRIDKIIGLFCKRAPLKRRCSAKQTYILIDPTDRSHPIVNYLLGVTVPLTRTRTTLLTLHILYCEHVPV